MRFSGCVEVQGKTKTMSRASGADVLGEQNVGREDVGTASSACMECRRRQWLRLRRTERIPSAWLSLAVSLLGFCRLFSSYSNPVPTSFLFKRTLHHSEKREPETNEGERRQPQQQRWSLRRPLTEKMTQAYRRVRRAVGRLHTPVERHAEAYRPNDNPGCVFPFDC